MTSEDSRIDWDAYEAELTTDPAPAVAVDDPTTIYQGSRTVRREPILPSWVRSRQAFTSQLSWAFQHAAHASGYHLVRSPWYGIQLTGYSFVGLGRSLLATARWVFDLEASPLRRASVRREESTDYMKLSAQRDSRVRLRVTLALGATVALGVAGIWLANASGLAQSLAIAGVVGLFGWIGRPADKPIVTPAVVTTRVARLTADSVVKALSVLGLAGINQALSKSPNAIGFAAPISRDGAGWRADIDLPPGVTAGDVLERRDRLASGLSRPLGCVWPEPAPHIHPGRLVLWVGDQDIAAAKPAAWPLLRGGQVDAFRPIPFGTDPRGRSVAVSFVYSNMLIGSIPGMGKTFSLRLPLLGLALDPLVRLWAFELKGTGDLEPVAKVAERYASGADDDTAEAALLALRDLRKECQRRAEVIKGLPREVCPENKVTPELARRRELGLALLVAAFDECQELFSHPDFGKEAAELAEKIIKLGRALGVILILATQRPDAKSLPTGVSANVGTRFSLRVMGQVENDMILGTSAYRNGLRATMFTNRDKGVGYLVGASDEPVIVRTYYLDGPTAERITDRARALRLAAGTLTGYAAGQDTAAKPKDTLLEDILTVLPAGEPKAWSEVIADRLAGLRPDVYSGWGAEQVAAALKPHGVGTGQVWGTDPTTGKGANRRGIVRDHVSRALTDRDGKRRRGSAD
ncbi:cell division protein FtsK [Catellatospora citrea]|uniref:Cell division protein FtsK n=1 Tax=Catellatospora citrea TaxID=53366 RepID=A0A8J3P433_9ACTN|nr:cell division protein FtsK [Catellatospora citrea]RKE09698.1 S-DNA-T family DNA segregation ATPase FtsK/SpoIIIE [Catellatospora citrea]GIG03271.1 cell division protein FtsK [Catellatospora citrea]